MSSSKHFDKIAIIGVILAVAFTLWFMMGASSVLSPMTTVEGEYLTDEDMLASLDTSDATVITLEGDGGTVEGSGASVSFGKVSITDGGVYVISGELTDGNIDVNAGGTDTVYIVLNGADISCSDDSALLVESASKVYLYLAKDSENSLYTSAAMESSVEAVAAGRDGCIDSRDDITIGGEGTLEVTGEYEAGIVCNDTLKITGGTLYVSAVGDGIVANDSIILSEADITLNAGDEGINAKSEDDGEGYITILSGSFDITSTGKGIKTAGTLEIIDGNITIEATDDAIHSDRDVTLTGGQLTLTSSDDGVHSDTAIYLNGTDITVKNAYEGIEAPIIEMNDGDVAITSTDDGFNGNGTGVDDTLVTVNGGNLTILNPTGMDADGLDSNGSIVINGGYVYISLTGGGTNSALDFGSENGGTCTINGGTVIAAGGSGMLEAVSDESAQGSITMVYDSTYEGGTTVTVTDSEGNELISQVVDDTMSAVTLSAEGITEGGTYTVTTGEDSEEVTLDTMAYANQELSGMGMMGGGRMGGGSMGGGSMGSGPMGGKGNMEDQGIISRIKMMVLRLTGGNQMGGQMQEWDMDNEETQITWYTPTASDWKWICAGTGVLLVAILFALGFRRRKRKF